MSKLGTLQLSGASGKKYDFEVYSINTEFNSLGAVYAITKRTKKTDGSHNHDIIYIGQTEDLSERFDDHHKADCFSDNSANCVCIHVDENKPSRLKKESDLISNYKPICND